MVSTTRIGGFRAVVFDAYGTLFDLAALEGACAAITDDPRAFAALWRSKQLEYALIRTVMDRYVEFGQITSDALDFTATARGVALDPQQRAALMRTWQTLPPFPDVAPALERLASGGLRLAVLSNGARHAVAELVRHAGLAEHLPRIMGADEVQAFKPHRAVYQLAPERLRARINELLFVTANGFDVAGAKVAGLTVCRVDRRGQPLDQLGVEPDMSVAHLGELADALGAG